MRIETGEKIFEDEYIAYFCSEPLALHHVSINRRFETEWKDDIHRYMKPFLKPERFYK